MPTMAAIKPKPASVPAWSSRVVKTSDGRLIVRGVDVPRSTWERVAAGKVLPASKSQPKQGFAVPKPITNKRDALATAKRAGLAPTSATKAGLRKK